MSLRFRENRFWKFVRHAGTCLKGAEFINICGTTANKMNPYAEISRNCRITLFSDVAFSLGESNLKICRVRAHLTENRFHLRIDFLEIKSPLEERYSNILIYLYARIHFTCSCTIFIDKFCWLLVWCAYFGRVFEIDSVQTKPRMKNFILWFQFTFVWGITSFLVVPRLFTGYTSAQRSKLFDVE